MVARSCRRSLAHQMAAARGILATSSPRSSPRRGRSIKRRLIDDDAPQSPAKRTRSKTVEDVPLTDPYKEEFSPPPEKMAPKSFYGRSTSRYVNPLDRAEQTKKVVDVSPAPVTITPKSVSALVRNRGRKSNVRRSTTPKQPVVKHKSFQQKERNIVLKGSTPEVPVSSQETEESVESAESVPPTPESGGKPKKFFRNRSSPGEKDHSRGSLVMLRKGLKLTYHRSANVSNSIHRSPSLTAGKNDGSLKRADMLSSLSKIKQIWGPKKPECENPLSQDMFSETSDYGAGEDDIENDRIITRSQSPRKIHSVDPTCSSPLRERNKQADSMSLSQYSISTDSAKADSVMLLSDMSSISSSVNTTTTESPSNAQKFFSIFSAKNSPAVKTTISSVTSSPQNSAPNSPHSSVTKTKLGKRTTKHLLRSLRDKDGKEQMVLDFGQKMGETVQCTTCGMTYTEDEPTDEATHAKFHQNIINVLKFPGWKKERICQDNPDGSRIIVVTTEDKFATKKVDAVRQIVDNELGFVVERRQLTPGMKMFLYISEEKQIIACCIAQEIRKGYRVLGESQPDSSQPRPGKPWCCSMTPEPAKCGISRIWVLASQRGNSIATQLVDCVRNHFMLGYLLQKEQIAFSDPTPDGRGFATKYTGTSTFLVYKLDSASQ